MSRRPYGADFWVSVTKTDTCWLWMAATTDQGYGKYWHPEKKVTTPAHVYAWEQERGEVPEGHELHHLCVMPSCVRLDHLVPLTPQQHKLAHAALITHCPAGHEYTPENTYVRSKGNGMRQCRRCHADQMKERRARV